MPRRISLLLLAFLLVCAVAAQSESTDFLPAGMLLTCTMDEPNFSAKTAEVGDPVLCHMGTTGAFGHIIFPRGAYLSGHLQDASAPGHFFGKGNLSIEFDRLVLPGQAILPLAAKIIAVPHYKVDRSGRINGKGHPKRDAVEWAIPVLWPIKILTLPARGPYPALKGEARLTLRLMEDVAIPLPQPTQNSLSVPMPPWARPGAANVSAPAPVDNGYHIMNAVQHTNPLSRAKLDDSTVVILKDQSAYVVDRYYLDGDTVHCHLPNGDIKSLALNDVDFSATIKLNRERGVGFILQSNPPLDRQ